MGKYRNLVVNTALFAANAVATKLVSFFLVPLYTAYMSAGEYGLTDMSLTVISLLTPLVTLDVAEAAVRFIVGDRARGDRYAAVALGVTVASVAVVAALSPLLSFPAFGGLGDYRGWFVAAYAASSLMTMCGEVARGMGEVRLIPVCAGASSLVTLASAVLLIAASDAGVVGYFASVTLGPAVAIAIYLTLGGLGTAVLRGARQLASSARDEVWALCGPMLRYALPLIPNSLFWWLGSGINRLFITGMLGIAASGMFAAASKVPNLLNTVYSIFQQAWQLSAFQESGEEGLECFFSRVFAIVQAGMTVLCAALSLLAPWVAALLLRGETYDAWPMIAPLLLSNLFNVFATFYGTVYSTTMHTSFIMKTTVLGALSCVVLTPLLIPAMGTYGACVASALGQGAVFLARAVDSRKYLRFDVGWRYLVPTLLLLVIQAVVTELRPAWWQVASFICLLAIIAIQGVRLLGVLRSADGLRNLLGRERG
ncbi:lipopolysaccharide biosynthesis protein [Thermophilibacter sp.]